MNNIKSLVVVIIFLLAMSGYVWYVKTHSSNSFELVYSDSSIVLKNMDGGKPVETTLVTRGQLPDDYEFQSTHRIQISPDGKRFAFAMNRGIYGGVGGGELNVTSKIYIADLNGSLKEIPYQDPYVGMTLTEAYQDYLEVEKWIDNQRLLIDRQSGHYINISNGKIVLNINGTVEFITENENLENDLRKLRE